MTLKAENIRKSFGPRTILDGVSASIEQGQIVALLGPSGSGKTTLLRALALLEHPDAGRISYNDQTWDFPWPKGKKLIAPYPKLTVVFQELFLWPHLTLRENILLPSRGIWNNETEAVLERVIAALDLGTFINNYPNEASLGQRQRVALARAVMLKPDFLLLDEITSALDVEQVHNILTFLPQMKKRGICMLLITHHINFARRAADKILFLADGKIAESGPPDILDSPKSERMGRFLSMIHETH